METKHTVDEEIVLCLLLLSDGERIQALQGQDRKLPIQKRSIQYRVELIFVAGERIYEFYCRCYWRRKNLPLTKSFSSDDGTHLYYIAWMARAFYPADGQETIRDLIVHVSPPTDTHPRV